MPPNRDSRRSFTDDFNQLQQGKLEHAIVAQRFQRFIAEHFDGFARMIAHVLNSHQRIMQRHTAPPRPPAHRP
jgi:hypothetical protein